MFQFREENIALQMAREWQPSDVIAGLKAQGCGIRRPAPPPEPPVVPQSEPVAAIEPEPAPEELQTGPEPPTVGLQHLLRVVAYECGIPINHLVSPRRAKVLVRARHIYFAVAKDRTARSFVQIGRFCGDRDHTTVLHGCRKVQGNPEAYEPYLSRVLARLGGTP